MKIGEKCILRVSPRYGYGERATGNIPPNSWLDFEVELLFWDDFTDVDDGKVTKKLIKQGKGSLYDKPKSDATVTVSYVGKYLKDPESHPTIGEFVTFTEGKDVQFVVDDDERFCEGFNVAVKDMIKEEESTFRLEPDVAYGYDGSEEYKIPPLTDVYFDITLSSFDNVE